MSTGVKKSTVPGTLGRRPTDSSLSSPAPPRGLSRSPTPSTTSSTNGVARTRSVRGGTPVSARAAMQRSGTGTSNLSSSNGADDVGDDARAETIALLDELKERLRASEIKSDHFQKEAE